MTLPTTTRSWVESANAPDTDFPVQNLPYGRFRRRAAVLVSIGALVLVGLVVVGIVIAALLRRRHRAGAEAVDDQDAYDYDDHEFGDGEYGDPQYADGGVDTEYGDELAPEGGHFDVPPGGPEFQSNPDVIDTAPTVYPDFTAEQPAAEPSEDEDEPEPGPIDPERIRSEVARPHGGLPVYTVSVGVASIEENPDTDTVDSLVERADQSMYRAKALGRNRTGWMGL